MAKYQRKPGVVDACQWQGQQWAERPVPPWVFDALNRRKSLPGAMYRDEDEMMVMTPDGERTCRVNDYVIRRGNGDLYVLSGEIFQQVYERSK